MNSASERPIEFSPCPKAKAPSRSTARVNAARPWGDFQTGPPTLTIGFSFIRTILSHAAAIDGIEVSAENMRLARIASGI
jgi:hypothetical protein